MKSCATYLRLIFFGIVVSWSAIRAQDAALTERFRSLPPAERPGFVYEAHLEVLDTATFLTIYREWMLLAQAQNDQRTSWSLRFAYFRHRHALGIRDEAKFAEDLEREAIACGLKAEAAVARHYAHFARYNQNTLPHPQLYAHILREFDQMRLLGFKAFRCYDPARLLFHSGRFMYKMEDFEKALKIFEAAENLSETNEHGFQTWVFIKNHLQTIYQQMGQYDKSLVYARQILELVKNYPCVRPEQHTFCRTWQGIALIDIASILFSQGKVQESEQRAAEGYQILKAPLTADKALLRAEYDMLQTLIGAKLALQKLPEAEMLLRRADDIAPILDRLEEPDYFKHTRFYQSYAHFYEMKGDYAAAVRYGKLAKTLQDSLNRRNDARRLEKIQQRLEAEKYIAQLTLAEREKRLQSMLLAAAALIILLGGTLAYVHYRRLAAKRRQALLELENAQGELEAFAQNFREKSELIENLRIELERLSHFGERSRYLEQLTQSTILTDDDWTRFRSVFERVHPDFIAVQKQLNPDLTQAELRYLVLEKLQLGAREMANMLGVSDGAIRQTRLRLRRKMNSGETIN